MTDQLEQLLPEPALVKAGGLDIEIKPLTIGQIPKITKLLKGVPLSLDPETIGSGEYWLGLIGEHGDNIIEVVAVASGQDKNIVSGFPLDDFVKLAVKVIEVNADFFTRKVMPAASQALAGLTSLNSSSATATGTATSPATP
jgi:hypothetical protein